MTTPADRHSADEAAIGIEPSPVSERPPLGDWRRLYAVVLLELALLIVLFYVFGRTFAGALAP